MGAASWVRRWSRFPQGKASRTRRTRRLGRWGERRAASYLRRHAGYRVLERNVQIPGGEIDLIMEGRRNEVVFVEVKTRRPGRWTGERAITKTKRRRLKQLMLRIARRRGWQRRALRIDVVVVTVSAWWRRPKIVHYRNIECG